MSHGPAHTDGRCAEDCILTTPAEYKELLALRVMFTAVEKLAVEWAAAKEAAAYHEAYAEIQGCAEELSAWLAPVRELRGDPQ